LALAGFSAAAAVGAESVTGGDLGAGRLKL
jgi:hypothetical protein